MKSIVSQGFCTLETHDVAPELQAKIDHVLSFEKGKDGSYSLTRKITKAIESLWEDQVVKEAFDNRADYQLCDSAEYFLNKFERVSSRNYLPNEKDICCVQSPTTQVNEKTYKINDAICT